MLCRHCQIRKSSRPRGLCRSCYENPAIRGQYSSLSKCAPRGEPTEAELEQMIAEQRRCLPEWWGEEAEEGLNCD